NCSGCRLTLLLESKRYVPGQSLWGLMHHRRLVSFILISSVVLFAHRRLLMKTSFSTGASRGHERPAKCVPKVKTTSYKTVTCLISCLTSNEPVLISSTASSKLVIAQPGQVIARAFMHQLIILLCIMSVMVASTLRVIKLGKNYATGIFQRFKSKCFQTAP